MLILNNDRYNINHEYVSKIDSFLDTITQKWFTIHHFLCCKIMHIFQIQHLILLFCFIMIFACLVILISLCASLSTSSYLLKPHQEILFDVFSYLDMLQDLFTFIAIFFMYVACLVWAYYVCKFFQTWPHSPWQQAFFSQLLHVDEVVVPIRILEESHQHLRNHYASPLRPQTLGSLESHHSTPFSTNHTLFKGGVPMLSLTTLHEWEQLLQMKDIHHRPTSWHMIEYMKWIDLNRKNENNHLSPVLISLSALSSMLRSGEEEDENQYWRNNEHEEESSLDLDLLYDEHRVEQVNYFKSRLNLLEIIPPSSPQNYERDYLSLAHILTYSYGTEESFSSKQEQLLWCFQLFLMVYNCIYGEGGEESQGCLLENMDARFDSSVWKQHFNNASTSSSSLNSVNEISIQVEDEFTYIPVLTTTTAKATKTTTQNNKPTHTKEAKEITIKNIPKFLCDLYHNSPKTWQLCLGQYIVHLYRLV